MNISNYKHSQSLILDAVQARSAELIAAAQALVAAPSPNPPGDVSLAADVAIRLLEVIPGVEVSRYEPAPGIVNVVARIDSGVPGRRLIFNGHLDTYPIGENLAWTVAPLGGLLADGKLYGRGVSDMKAGIASSIIAASVLAHHREGWSGEIVIALAGDEESMGQLGSQWLLEHVEFARGDAMICGDVGSPRIIRFGEKGLLWIEVTATGKAAHGAHVHKGINAIDRLRTALDAIKQLENILVETPFEITKEIIAATALSESISGIGESDVLRQVTVNIGTIEGGTSPNLVPTLARAQGDIRLPIGISTNEIIKKVNEWLQPMEGVTWRVVQRYEPSYTSPDHEIIKLTRHAASQVTGEAVVKNMRVGASDARLYRAFGVPTVVLGCTPFGMGAADEYVLVEELIQVAQIHALVALEYLSQGRETSVV
jgi:acetylornithine deacetylase/succinyl-diaminopimelate desuccinylase-like protein